MPVFLPNKELRLLGKKTDAALVATAQTEEEATNSYATRRIIREGLFSQDGEMGVRGGGPIFKKFLRRTTRRGRSKTLSGGLQSSWHLMTGSEHA